MTQYRLKPHQEWFLKYMMERHPLGLAGTHKRPPDMPPQCDMQVVRGFIKRGWMYEVHGICLYYLSEEGLKVTQQLQMYRWIGNHPLATKLHKSALAGTDTDVAKEK